MSLEVIERDNRAARVKRITQRDRSCRDGCGIGQNPVRLPSLSESDSALPPSLGFAWPLIEPRKIIGGEASETRESERKRGIRDARFEGDRQMCPGHNHGE